MTTYHTNGGPRLELLATTGNIAHADSKRSRKRRNHGENLEPFIESAHWTADGTFVLTSSSNNQIAGYIVPEDLLDPKTEAIELEPACRVQLPERSNVLASSPYFNLSEPYTHQVLVSSRDHPIQLFYLQPSSPADSAGQDSSSSTPSNATDDSDEDDESIPSFQAGRGSSSSSNAAYPPAASFPFIKPRSEIFETATALIWPAPGNHFIAGTRNMLAKFDVTRPGSGPVLHVKTVPSSDQRHLSTGAGGAGVGMLRGTISAMSVQPGANHYSSSSSGYQDTGLVAAGTWTRWVGLYDFAGSGQCVTAWSVASAAAETARMGSDDRDESHHADYQRSTRSVTPHQGVGGAGVIQTKWSPCGRYLLINERRSRGILVYDVRVTGKLLGWLSGRDALGNQRIECDVYPTGGSGGGGSEESNKSGAGGGGFEVWSGTTQGVVKVWEGVGTREGRHEPSWDWQAHETAVSGACLHQSGSVVATASGSWEFSGLDSDDNTSRSSSSSSSLSDSDSNASRDNRDWMRRRVKESSLKLWGIASGLDHEE